MFANLTVPPHRHIAASNEGLIVGRPVRHAILRLIPGMNLRLHPRSMAPAESPEKCGPRRPTRSGSSCNNAPRGGLAERECGLQIPAHGAQNQLRIAVSTLEDRRPACQLHDCQQPAAIRHRCNTAKARTFNTFSSLPGLAVSRKYFGVGEDTERGRPPARRAAAPQPPAGGRSRSACVANGRVRHEGEGAFRRALPCVLYRV